MSLALLILSIANAQTLSWDPVLGVDGYKVNYAITEDCSPAKKLKYSVDIGNVTAFNPYDDINFHEGLSYKFQVSAYAGKFEGDLSQDAQCLVVGDDMEIKNVKLKKK